MRHILGIFAATLVFQVLIPSASSQEITRGPYLQLGTDTSIVIVWRTDTKTLGQVWLGTHPTALEIATSDSEARIQHEIRLTGLKPGQRYFYAVGDKYGVRAGSAEHSFVTAPPKATPSAFRMWVVGDSGNGSKAQRNVRDAASNFTHGKFGDLYLHMGDMAYSDGEDREFQKYFFEVYSDVLRNTVVWPTLGNHEGRMSDSDTESGPYYDAFVLPRGAEAGGLASGTEAYYSFDYANVHFVVLDSHESDRKTNGPMLTWLVRDLEATKQDWIIAFWHHPPYSKGSHDSDRERQLQQMRENALPILEAAGVDLVLGGHSHIYERSHLLHGAYDTPTSATGHILTYGNVPYVKPQLRSDGAVYVVAGHGGAGIRSQKRPHPVMSVTETKHGSLFLDIHDKALVGRNIRFDGEVTDSFSIVKGEGIVITHPLGGETWAPNSKGRVEWTAEKDNRFLLELSQDDGKTWLPYGWQLGGEMAFDVPDTMDTQEARIRLTSADGKTSAISRPFSIGAAPTNSTPIKEAPRPLISEEHESVTPESHVKLEKGCNSVSTSPTLLPLLLIVLLASPRRRKGTL